VVSALSDRAEYVTEPPTGLRLATADAPCEEACDRSAVRAAAFSGLD